MSDHAALIAEADKILNEKDRNEPHRAVAVVFRELRDALEAVQQAPAEEWPPPPKIEPDAFYNIATGALQFRTDRPRVQQTPAVDRGALIDVLNQAEHAPMEDHDPRDGSCRSCPWPVHMLGAEVIADTIRTSGILLDAAEVEARGLEAFGFWLLDIGHMTDLGRANMKFLIEQFARAQQVREGN